LLLSLNNKKMGRGFSLIKRMKKRIRKNASIFDFSPKSIPIIGIFNPYFNLLSKSLLISLIRVNPRSILFSHI
jgi:hypothetical protein